ncbi:MAG TPA: class I SAM-dependent methyltransferase [Candidatus Sulfotelmatobacter sp.]|jgi:SAM-dependent methyltransferase|nr:class I SAM-dependent methyltransferase [Candidatus Sulfotelmatobacter sp.]
MNVEYVAMTLRDQRAEFIARRFAPYLKGRVLDVGCDRARLKQLVPGIQYFGIDVGGTPDLVVNLEKERLPFPDRSFDCIVCSDVLEHLDNFHENFSELARVTAKHIILSLPNNWANARKAIERGRGQFSHYGLPAEPSADRHKWFFCLTEARDFVEARAPRHGLSITEMFAVEKPRAPLLRWLRQCRYPNQDAYLNRYSHSLWAVCSRTA